MRGVKIPLNVPEEIEDLFLNYLRADLLPSGHLSVYSDWDSDGCFFQSFESSAGLKDGEMETRRWSLHWSDKDRLSYVLVVTESIAERVRTALSDALQLAERADLQDYFVSEMSSYFGKPFGESIEIDDARLIPMSTDGVGGALVEQLALTEVRVAAVDHAHAKKVGRLAVRRFRDTLSALAGVGFDSSGYRIRWVRESETRYVRRKLGQPLVGSIQSASDPWSPEGVALLTDQMVSEDTAPLPGSGIVPAGSFPPEVEWGFDAVTRLSPADRHAFEGAARLLQLGLALGTYSSSVLLAYHVAAVDSLIRGSGTRAFVAFVTRLCPHLSEEFARSAFVDIRSEHFHTGRAVGSDRFSGLIIHISSPAEMRSLSEPWQIANALRGVVIAWLREQAEGQPDC